MADQPKSLWPKTPDGTTDWEVVFEDPDKGFISLIIQAQSIASLRSGALVVIQQLFTRRADKAEIELLKNRLDAVTSFGKAAVANEDALATAREDIAGLLRGVKEERKQKAAEYIANKRGAQSIERRVKKKKKKKGRLKKALKIFAAPKVWIPILATVLVLIAGGSWLLFSGSSGEVEPETDKAPSAASPAAPAEVEEKIPPIIVLKPVRWQNPNARGGKREMLFLPLLDLIKEDDRQALCGWRASILDILNVTLSTAFGSGAPLSPENLAQAGAEAARDVNARIGKAIVKKVTLLPNPNRRLLSGARRNCLLVTKEEYKKWGLAGGGE
ncbi:MAG TPA: hypothetical protein ENI72_01800 [Rhodospirillales bacterium]|nr:hypothetical protein [Rhodospirillales bacterium]